MRPLRIKARSTTDDESRITPSLEGWVQACNAQAAVDTDSYPVD